MCKKQKGFTVFR